MTAKMTLDEAIKHAEEVMVENLEKSKCRNASDPIAIKCGECAEEHRQLAEWLRELKDYREVWTKIKEQIREESDFAYADFDKYKCEVLGVDADELPDDDFRFGMIRAYEITNEHISKVKE